MVFEVHFEMGNIKLVADSSVDKVNTATRFEDMEVEITQEAL